ncbi:MAG TPA: cyclic nucleotide-binding domain-containing protein, partial [Magnetococcales bacterium]|nr:cyclic nucleotide-binding domain-containing protein [Magnetococcales bacterium]
KLFLEKINSSGWIEQVSFKEIFSGISGAAFVKYVDYPLLYGDSVADIEVVNVGGKISLNFNQDQDSVSRIPLSYIFPFVNKDPLRRAPGMFFLGATSENQFIVPDYTVSKKHAVFTKKRSGYYLKDLQSEFGSYINGVSFGNKETLLSDGDHLAFGRYQFIFLNPKTFYEHVWGGSKKKPLTFKEESGSQAGLDLKQNLNESSLYIAECIANKKFDDVESKLLSILSFIPFFNSFSVYEKKQIVSFHKKLIMARPQETIVREKEESNNFFIILKGKVDIIKGGSQTPLNSLGPGNSFGEVAFLMGTPRSANVVAQEATIMFTIDRDFYENIGIEIREKIKDQIIRQISANIIRQNHEIKEFNKDNLLPEAKLPRKREKHIDLAEKRMQKMAIAKFVDENPVFSKLTKYHKVSLTVLLETLESYDAGEVIIKENSLHNGIYFIVEGSVYITVSKNDVILAELSSGDLFGEISTFGKKTTSANVIAKDKVKIVRISADDLSVMSVEIREKLKDIILEQLVKRQTIQNASILHFMDSPVL